MPSSQRVSGASDENLRVGLCSITLRQLSIEEVIDVSIEASIRGIEWGADVHVPPGDLRAADEAASRCADAGIDCASYGSYLGAAATDDAALAQELSDVLASAEALAVPLIRVWTEFRVTSGSPELQRQTVITRTGAIADAAASRGLDIALEFHPGTLTETATSAMALLSELDRPNVWTHWQPDPSLDSHAAVSELEIVLPKLGHLHTFSWGPSGIDDRKDLSAASEMWGTAFEMVSSAEVGLVWPRYALLEYVKDDDPAQVITDARTAHRFISGEYSSESGS